jgi:hypothetical protein
LFSSITDTVGFGSLNPYGKYGILIKKSLMSYSLSEIFCILTSKSPVSATSGLGGGEAISEVDGTGADSSTTCGFSSTIGTSSGAFSASSGLYVRRSRAGSSW